LLSILIFPAVAMFLLRSVPEQAPHGGAVASASAADDNHVGSETEL
jgi:hypothetical protein